VLLDHLAQTLQQDFEPRGEIALARFDATADDVAQAPGIFLDDAEARDLQPRIDAQDLQSTAAVV
jgi:hypothetical protein